MHKARAVCKWIFVGGTNHAPLHKELALEKVVFSVGGV